MTMIAMMIKWRRCFIFLCPRTHFLVCLVGLVRVLSRLPCAGLALRLLVTWHYLLGSFTYPKGDRKVGGNREACTCSTFECHITVPLRIFTRYYRDFS